MPPYSEDLVDRVRAGMSHLGDVTERAVMSGIGFFIDDRMTVAVLEDGLCFPAGEAADDLVGVLASPLEFAGREIPGWVCISESSLDEETLFRWVSYRVAEPGLPM